MNKPSLRLEVKNLGPIAEGAVELKPFTVFIGPNNSGKSYLATFIYALYQSFEGHFKPPYRLPPYAIAQEHLEGLREQIEEWARTTVQQEKLNRRASAVLPSDLAMEVCQQFNEALLSNEFRQVLGASLRDYFGCERIADLVRGGGNDDGLQAILTEDRSKAEFFSMRVEKSGRSATTSASLSTDAPIRMPVDPIIDELLAHRSDIMITFVVDAWWGILEQYAFPMGMYYLPAARSGIFQLLHTYTTMALGLVRQRFGTGVEFPLFTGVVGDFLQDLSEMMAGNQSRTGKGRSDALAVLQGKVFQGSLNIKRRGRDTPEIMYSSNGMTLPIQRTSSMIGELTPLYLWIKNLLRGNDWLILDEPEAHVHPEAQRLVTTSLVRLVNAGTSVICTTHSSTVLHQLSNHILASNASKETRDAAGMSKNDVLDANDVRVYLFKPTGDGTQIVPVDIEPGFGIHEDEFVRVADAIGDETSLLIPSSVNGHA